MKAKTLTFIRAECPEGSGVDSRGSVELSISTNRYFLGCTVFYVLAFVYSIY